MKSKYICKMEVIKRDGRREKVSFDKIIARMEGICEKQRLKRIDPIEVARDTIQGLYDGIKTEELDFYAANKCAEKILEDPEYNKLAAGLCISNLQKTTSNDFMTVTEKLYNNKDKFGDHNPLVTKEYFDVVKKNIDKINSVIDYNRDFYFDFFSIKTLERAYLIRLKNLDQEEKNKKSKQEAEDETVLRRKYGRVIERPQHLIMRVAIGIHGDDIDDAIKTYDLISEKYFTHASPTLYNAGSPTPQLSSCFLLGIDDSIDGIFKTISNAGKISKWAGGIGIHISNIRASGSLIRGTNGNSDGIIPLTKVFNSVARYVNQGGRRNGAIALYLEPYHADIFAFCELKQNTGAEELRARDIFLALWVPDLFMKRVKEGGYWSLMCPDECPNLSDTYGEEFEKLYIQYEEEGRYKKRVKAEDLWYHIISNQIETGMPYMLFKDNANRQSNQQNIGVIKSSNLCSEIIEYSNANEIAVCNLNSICLPRFIETDDNGNKFYNYDKLLEIAKVCAINLDKIIDINYYPVPEAEKSNMKHRPIGIGVQGLADVYCILELPFDSKEASIVNKKIFETIYFGALTASCERAKKLGPYSTFTGSPFSKGQLQYHLWGLTEDELLMDFDWQSLIQDIKKYGVRNSLLTAIMPTASTSQIMTNNEATEPYTSNLYTRTTLAGEYIVVNKHLIEKLIEHGLWTKEIQEEFFFDNGSIQNIEEIPDKIKEIYKTAYEMKTKPIVDQAVGRGPFIDQSQSMNLFSNEPDFNMLTKSHFYSWSNKLKTGMYYLRSKPVVDPIKFGLDPEARKRIQKKRSIYDLESDEDLSDKYINEEDDRDPRRINEIEINHGNNRQRANNYVECEMCSG